MKPKKPGGDQHEQKLDNAVGQLSTLVESLVGIRDEYMYELKVKNESFFNSFSDNMENLKSIMNNLKSGYAFHRRRIRDVDARINRKEMVHKKELEIRENKLKQMSTQIHTESMQITHLQARNENLEKKILQLEATIKNQNNQIEELTNQKRKKTLDLMKLNDVRLEEENPHSGRSTFRGSAKRKNCRTVEVAVNTESNEGCNSQTYTQLLTDDLLDELIVTDFQMTQESKYFGKEEKRMGWEKVKFLVEKNYEENFYNLKLEYLTRQKDQFHRYVEEGKNSGMENLVTYYLGKLQEFDEMIRLTLENRYIAFKKQTTMVRTLDEKINRRIKKKREREVEDLSKSKHPRGKMCIVFTDIMSSTQLWSLDSAMMIDALQIHNKVIRSFIPECNAYEVKTDGDSFMLAFQNVFDAADFCVKVQIALINADWPESLLGYTDGTVIRNFEGMEIFRGLRVRMGMHFGIPATIKINNLTGRFDYYGALVNKASRIESSARGGEILLSEATFEELEASERIEDFFVPVVFHKVGYHQLKGFMTKELLRRITPEILIDRIPYFRRLGIGSSAAVNAVRKKRMKRSGSTKNRLQGNPLSKTLSSNSVNHEDSVMSLKSMKLGNTYGNNEIEVVEEIERFVSKKKGDSQNTEKKSPENSIISRIKKKRRVNSLFGRNKRPAMKFKKPVLEKSNSVKLPDIYSKRKSKKIRYKKKKKSIEDTYVETIDVEVQTEPVNITSLHFEKVDYYGTKVKVGRPKSPTSYDRSFNGFHIVKHNPNEEDFEFFKDDDRPSSLEKSPRLRRDGGEPFLHKSQQLEKSDAGEEPNDSLTRFLV